MKVKDTDYRAYDEREEHSRTQKPMFISMEVTYT